MAFSRDIKKYNRPNKIKLRDEEITSHSSLLTNQRLSLVFGMCDNACMTAYSNTNIPNIHNYFASVKTIYNTVFSAFNIITCKKIEKYMDEYYELYFSFVKKENATLKNCYKLLFIVDKMHKKIVETLQEMHYFFRKEVFEKRGMGSALEGLKMEEEEK